MKTIGAANGRARLRKACWPGSWRGAAVSILVACSGLSYGSRPGPTVAPAKKSKRLNRTN